MDSAERSGSRRNGNGRCTCKLRRADGTEWLVTDLEVKGGGALVTGMRLGTNGKAGIPDPEARLENEPLRSGDRLEWLGADGEVTWAMKTPVSGRES